MENQLKPVGVLRSYKALKARKNVASKKAGEYGKGSTPNPAVSKFAGLQESTATGPLYWGEIDGRLIKGAICAATENGAALVFASTSDGGALALTVLDGPNRVKKYFNSTATAESWLTEFMAVAST